MRGRRAGAGEGRPASSALGAVLRVREGAAEEREEERKRREKGKKEKERERERATEIRGGDRGVGRPRAL